jgi:tetratricopeptide (TPR) repeat protein
MLNEAITEYQRVLAKYSAIPLPRYRLALAYEKRGRIQEAREQYRRFLEEWKTADSDAPEFAAAARRGRFSRPPNQSDAASTALEVAKAQDKLADTRTQRWTVTLGAQQLRADT